MAKFVKAPQPEAEGGDAVLVQTTWLSYWHDAPIMYKLIFVLVFIYVAFILFMSVSSFIARRKARLSPVKKSELGFDSHWDPNGTNKDDRP